MSLSAQPAAPADETREDDHGKTRPQFDRLNQQLAERFMPDRVDQTLLALVEGRLRLELFDAAQPTRRPKSPAAAAC